MKSERLPTLNNVPRKEEKEIHGKGSAQQIILKESPLLKRTNFPSGVIWVARYLLEVALGAKKAPGRSQHKHHTERRREIIRRSMPI